MNEIITRILVPVDFSLHAERAVSYAAALAKRLGANVGLLHVVEDPFVSGAWHSEITAPNVAELLEALISAAEHRLHTLQQSAAALGVAVDTSVITGRPASAILERAADGGFDLIVMGTHGRTGLSHVVMGSVAERVARKAPCPVLTVRAAPQSRTTVKPAAA